MEDCVVAGSGARGAGRPVGGAPGWKRRLPRLHVIAGDTVVLSDDYRRRLSPVIGAGSGRLALHLRARATPASRIFQVAVWLAGASHAEGTLLVINDRVDIALAAGAGGVQLREDSLPVEVVRAIAGDTLVVGRSIHAASQAGGFRGSGPDYLVMGAAYSTASHPGRAPAGPESVEAAAAQAHVPVLAIGGITPARVPDLIARGAHGVVVKSGVWERKHPGAAVARYLQVLHRRPRI